MATNQAVASRQPEANTAQADRLLAFRDVNRLTGSQCKTGHAARELAKRGLIRCVRLNERTIRYSERSVLDLIAGKAEGAQ
jgi:hypothetical protein